ncbi:cellulose synthase complex periplasmic endoglucanase BcsZ [Vibrio fluminensis]|uniref:cellulose synthase complex periplasmic endoglucanase BcsZ n=1 Tax=Vibrio fluminensis TaxID=2783614 RepID=UPI0018887DA0|nr:cellulose synthase complex periplasmic endoglucanase BcsZ [Vibrio fluminensis]
MKKLMVLVAVFLSSSVFAESCEWSQWQTFKSVYIEQGRVVDGSDSRRITTSEGQSYALFFALVANDKQTFANLLNWTQQHLAGGDLTAQLPAWLWGKKANGQWGVLDSNPASDSDLWIAYTLVEAGRLWDNYYYQSLGYLLASRILREETVTIEDGGLLLLPAPKGFVLEDGYRVNPSYVPLQVIARMRSLYPQQPWGEMYQTSVSMLTKTMPKGFSPDWALEDANQYQTDPITGTIGSYNAIRTYLWAGMLNDSVAEKSALVEQMQPFVEATSTLGAPPREVNTQTGKFSNKGSAGFSAAALPLIDAVADKDLLQQQAERANTLLVSDRNDYYYDNVLSLFGMGWHQGHYRFGLNGELVPAWSNSCQ